ncbi:hypothetical protein GCM10026987_05750 [Belliella aquatica]|uniref:Uncharacterized protein n=1 Tax=Belliella aquatica TaxID=1323734 RepID=A0ABQ1N2C2_9BACT|nr:hypothetical protein GCM10010993_27650 [Belliella aquatica]
MERNPRVSEAEIIPDYSYLSVEEDRASFSKILLYYLIPDSLKIESPRTGWTEVPEEIRRY